MSLGLWEIASAFFFFFLTYFISFSQVQLYSKISFSNIYINTGVNEAMLRVRS